MSKGGGSRVFILLAKKALLLTNTFFSEYGEFCKNCMTSKNEDGRTLQNMLNLSTDCTLSHSRRHESCKTLP